jgi:hypothetical protein
VDEAVLIVSIDVVAVLQGLLAGAALLAVILIHNYETNASLIQVRSRSATVKLCPVVIATYGIRCGLARATVVSLLSFRSSCTCYPRKR